MRLKRLLAQKNICMPPTFRHTFSLLSYFLQRSNRSHIYLFLYLSSPPTFSMDDPVYGGALLDPAFWAFELPPPAQRNHHPDSAPTSMPSTDTPPQRPWFFESEEKYVGRAADAYTSQESWYPSVPRPLHKKKEEERKQKVETRTSPAFYTFPTSFPAGGSLCASYWNSSDSPTSSFSSHPSCSSSHPSCSSYPPHSSPRSTTARKHVPPLPSAQINHASSISSILHPPPAHLPPPHLPPPSLPLPPRTAFLPPAPFVPLPNLTVHSPVPLPRRRRIVRRQGRDDVGGRDLEEGRKCDVEGFTIAVVV